MALLCGGETHHVGACYTLQHDVPNGRERNGKKDRRCAAVVEVDDLQCDGISHAVVPCLDSVGL